MPAKKKELPSPLGLIDLAFSGDHAGNVI